MKVSPISIAHAKNYRNYNVKKQNVETTPNFKGWGSFGTVGGALVGLGLTALSGGALFWTIPAISGGAGLAGDIYEKNCKKNPSSDDSDYNSYCPVYRD